MDCEIREVSIVNAIITGLENVQKLAPSLDVQETQNTFNYDIFMI